MFFISRGILFWVIWLIFADKKRWREIFPVCFFASALGSTTDHLMHYFDFWRYNSHLFNKYVLNALDDWEVYIVVTYLFIQWLPKNKNIKNMLLYWFVWSGFAVIVEWIHLVTKHMTHHNGWTLWHSYLSDWILFGLFYKIYKIFRFEKLSQ